MRNVLRAAALATAACFVGTGAFAQSGAISKAVGGYSFEDAAKDTAPASRKLVRSLDLLRRLEMQPAILVDELLHRCRLYFRGLHFHRLNLGCLFRGRRCWSRGRRPLEQS